MSLVITLPGGGLTSFNGWWRDKKDDIELFRKTDEYIKYKLENYIVWKKVGVDN